MPDYQPTNHVFLGPAEEVADPDTVGGIVYSYKATVALKIGDAVFHDQANPFSVTKSNTVADYVNFAGIVVGGEQTIDRVFQDDEVIGTAAAAIGERVLVAKSGKVKVVADAAIAVGAPITQGAVTPGRVDDAGAVAGRIIGNALEPAAVNGDIIVAFISHR